MNALYFRGHARVRRVARDLLGLALLVLLLLITVVAFAIGVGLTGTP